MDTSTVDTSFTSLYASCFFEGLRRQQRHQKISDKFSPPTDSTWQISIPERLFGLSGLGLFEFDFFATSSGDELLFVDDQHPMVTHGRIPPPGPDAAIHRLRAQFPATPEFHAHGLQGDDLLLHGVCAIAAVHTDALFYYRGPTHPESNSAIWILVQRAIPIAIASHDTTPANLAALTPPRADFGSYDALVAAFDATRPAGHVARLNEFRISVAPMLFAAFPHGVTFKALFLGFLARNGYTVQESPAQATSDQELVDVAVILNGAPSLTGRFDSAGRLLSMDMAITADAYVDDE